MTGKDALSFVEKMLYMCYVKKDVDYLSACLTDESVLLNESDGKCINSSINICNSFRERLDDYAPDIMNELYEVTYKDEHIFIVRAEYRLVKSVNKNQSNVWENRLAAFTLKKENDRLVCVYISEKVSRFNETEDKKNISNIYDDIPCGIIRYSVADRKYSILSINKMALSIFGYVSIDECIKDSMNNVLNMIEYEDLNSILANLDVIRNLGDKISYEYRVNDGDNVIWIYGTSELIANNEGQIILQCVLFDITDRKNYEREEKLAKVLRTTYDLITYVDLQTGMYEQEVFSSNGIYNMPQTGVYDEEIKRAAITEVYLEDATKFMRNLNIDNYIDAMENNRDITVRYRLNHMPLPIWLESRVTFIKNNNSTYACIITKNITNIIAQETLMYRKEKVIQSLGNMYSEIYIIDLNKKIISPLSISGKVEDTFNIYEGDCDTVLLKAARTQFAEEDYNKFCNSFSYEAIKRQQSLKISKSEVELRRKKGSEYHWTAIMCYIENKKDENIAILTVRDIDRQKQAEIENSLKEQKLGKIISGQYESITDIDLISGMFRKIYFNNKDHDRDEEKDYMVDFIDRINSRIDERDRDKAYSNLNLNMLKKMYKSNNNREKILKLRIVEDGGIKWMEYRIIFAKGHDKVSLVARNITDEVMMAAKVEQQNVALKDALMAAREASNAKSDFLSRMSHDMRTPMNAIIGMVSIARRNMDKKEKITDCLDKIDMSSNLLLRLINGILDMSKIESGKITLAIEEFSLDELIEEIKVIVMPQIKQKKQHFNVSYNNLRHKRVYSDKLRLEQVIINVISNSMKFTDNEGHIDIAIEEEESQYEEYAHYTISIKDTGKGMSSDFIEKIFDPFEREDNTLTNKVQGTGLGMAISKSIVEMMNGYIEVWSEPKVGTCITINLNLKYVELDNCDSVIRLIEEEEIITDFSSKRILLVEDNDINREIALELLEETNAVIEVAVNGKEAVDKFADSTLRYYDLIFMDIQMPLMNGYEATRAIRKLDREDAANVPIVAMTANAFDEDVRNALEAGMNEHVAKPIDVERLFKIMTKLIYR